MTTPAWLSPHLWRLRDSLLKAVSGDKVLSSRWEVVAKLATFLVDAVLLSAILGLLWFLAERGWFLGSALLAGAFAMSAVRWYGEYYTGVLLRPVGAWWSHLLVPTLSWDEKQTRLYQIMAFTPWEHDVKKQWVVHEFWGALALWAADPQLRSASLASELRAVAPATQPGRRSRI